MTYERHSPIVRLATVSAVVALLSLGAQASSLAPEGPAAGTAKILPSNPSQNPPGQAPANPVAAALAEPDCHGPLYYKMKEDEEKKRKHEDNRKEVMRFTYDVQNILVKQQAADRLLLLNKKLEDSKRCAAAIELPSLLCTAYAKRSLDACRVLPDGMDSIICRVLLGLDLGVEEALSKARGGQEDARFQTDDLAVLMILGAVRDGRMACPPGVSGSRGQKCQAIAEAVAPGGAPATAQPEVRTLATWILALRQRNPVLCAGLPRSDHVEFCDAYLRKDLSLCRIRRSMVDHVDKDWSCRSTLLATRLHPIKQGSEVVLTLGSPYQGTGICSVQILVEFGGTQNRRAVNTLTLKQMDVVEVRIPLSGEKFLRAESACQWSDPILGAQNDR